MDRATLDFHLENLSECDPNYVVDVLGVTSKQLIDAFHTAAITFIYEEFGDEEDEEDFFGE